MYSLNQMFWGYTWSPARYQMQGAEERRFRRMPNTPQGGANEGNAADDALPVARAAFGLDIRWDVCYPSPVIFCEPLAGQRSEFIENRKRR
jgi:hypothetical protein